MELAVEQLVDAGLYDPDAPDASTRLGLLRVLERRGASLDLMVRANKAGRLQRLAALLLVYGPVDLLTTREVADAAGVSADRFTSLWRTAGFPDPSLDDRRFTDAEVELVRLVEVASDLFGEPATMQLLRVIGSSVSRVAEAAISTFVTAIGPTLDPTDQTGDGLSAANQAAIDLVPQLSVVMADLLRQHLIEGARTDVTGDGVDTVTAAVGFVDVVGSTALGSHLPASDVGRAIARFEEVAADVVIAHGGRVVKFIGDEVMYRVHDPAAACRIALALVQRFSDDVVLAGVRGAVAFGDLLARDGDYFGPIVNIAARATKLAPPGQVVGTDAVRTAVASDPGLDFAPMTSRELRGISDPVALFIVTAPAG